MADPSTILTSLLTSVAVVGAATWLVRTWARAEIVGAVTASYAKALETHKAELRAETDKEIERFRAEIDRQRSIQAAATAAFAAAHTAAAERRLVAVERAWRAAIRIRDSANSLIGHLDIFTREELADALQDARMAAGIGSPTENDLTEMIGSPGVPVERMRPFLEEPVWALFYGYRALLGRVVITLNWGRATGRIQFWLDDQFTRNLLASLVDATDLARIQSMLAGGLGEAQRAIEVKLVEVARRMISGEASSEAALQRARLVLDQVIAAERSASVSGALS